MASCRSHFASVLRYTVAKGFHASSTMTAIITLRYDDPSPTGTDPQIKSLLKHLDLLRREYPIVIPGSPLPKTDKILCLTFDEPTLAFYHHVFPFLQRYQIQVILGVSTHLLNSSQDNLYCTSQQLKQMADSGWVKLAVKGHHNRRLTDNGVDLVKELVDSKQMLLDQTNAIIDYFIYPEGKYTRRIHGFVKYYYAWGFGMGNASHPNYPNKTRLIHRISATPFWQNNLAFLEENWQRWKRNYWLHQLLRAIPA